MIFQSQLEITLVTMHLSLYPGIYIESAAGYKGAGGITIGDSASYSGINSSGIAIGNRSLKNILSGIHNIGLGKKTLESTTSGEYDVSVGLCSLNDNTSGSNYVAIGNNTLGRNTIGNDNRALGSQAVFFRILNNPSTSTAIGANAKV